MNSRKTWALKLMKQRDFGVQNEDWDNEPDQTARRIMFKALKCGVPQGIALRYVKVVARDKGVTVNFDRLTSVARYDTDKLNRTDLRRFLSFADFKQARRDEWHGPCPVCGGTDRFIFSEREHIPIVTCRKCVGTGQGEWMDAIGFIEWSNNCTFADACEVLGGDKVHKPVTERGYSKPMARVTNDWDYNVALAITNHCAGQLEDENVAYLSSRGISLDLALEYKLGRCKNAGEWKGVYLHKGLTIPCFNSDGQVEYIKIRTGNGYKHATGGNARVLYLATSYAISDTAIVVETELDALMLATRARELGLKAAIYATPAGQNAHFVDDLVSKHRTFTAFDNDEAGQNAAIAWGLPQLRYEGKDVGDLYNGSWDKVDALFKQAGCRIPDIQPKPPVRTHGVEYESVRELYIEAYDNYMETEDEATGQLVDKLHAKLEAMANA